MNRRSFLATAALVPLTGAVAAEPPRRIGVGQIGTSHGHAAGKMSTLRALPDLYDVVGIAEHVPGRRAMVQEDAAYAGLTWFEEDVLRAHRAIEVIVIETTLALSATTAMACVRSGKHLHLDKPGAASHAEFVALRREAARRRLRVQMGYMLRYNPAFELLFRAHREGWLGEVTEVDASMGKLGDAALLAELQDVPGHGMFELACHLVDAVVHLLGPPAAVHAFARPTGLMTGGWPDNQLAVLEYPKTIVTLRCNHGDPFGGPHRRFQVVGTRGAMEIQPLESGQGSLHLTREAGGYRKGENRLALPVPSGRYTGEFQDLARVLRDDRPLAWSAEHDIAVHATALRCAGISPDVAG